MGFFIFGAATYLHIMQCAKDFRKEHSGYSFTTVGYSTSPRELNAAYYELVTITTNSNVRGLEETHICNHCKEEVYNRIHR